MSITQNITNKTCPPQQSPSTTTTTANAPCTTDHESTHSNDSTDSNEHQLNETLRQLQKAKNIKIFESKEMTQKRRHIICEVEKLTTQWIQRCLKKNDSLPQSQIDKSSSYICAFGSYELNVHFESSDIDLLCIGPKYITRDMLFTEFVTMLETDPRVTDILQLRHAFVPLLKFSFEGIDIDLVYAQWDIEVIDTDHKKEDINVFSSNFVKDQDTLFSLNGVRSTQTIKKLIPNKCIFEKTLRIIKFWAQQRAIYSNVMGFLGGISWSIMTALICIQHPKAINCVEIIKEFFAKYKDYDEYPTSSICLDHALYDKMYDDDKDDEISFNDFIEYRRNEFAEIMPILTPARPSMNCAYNVIESTKSLIIEELRRGYEITTTTSAIDWNQLFSVRHLIDTTSAIYDDENVYIRIQCVPDPTNLFYKKWSAFVESKIRNLVKKLNRELFDSTFYPYSTRIKWRNIDNFFIAGRYNIDFEYRQNNENAINMALQQFQHQMDTSSVRYDSALKCQLKLDVYRHGEMHALLSTLQDPNTSAAIYPQYNLLQQIQLMNIATATVAVPPLPPPPPATTYHVPQPAPSSLPPQPRNHHHHRHSHHHNNRRHHHHHHHNRQQPAPRHRRTQYRTRGGNNNNTFMPSVYGAPMTAKASDTAMEKTQTPPKDDEDESTVMKDDSDSNESTDGVTCASSSDSQANNNLMSFQVPNMSNISSFPIIKIQQQGLPHLPPFVSTQNGHTPPNEHYPFITNQNANNNNSSGWIHKMLLENNNKSNNNPTPPPNKVKSVQNSVKSNPIATAHAGDKDECIFDDKENKSINIPKGNFIPHKRVKIPDAFVSDLNVMESEQFGYPSPNKMRNSANSLSKAHCDKSTLVIHPARAALSTNHSKTNVNIKPNAMNQSINQNINNTINGGNINICAPININITNPNVHNGAVNGNVLNAVLLQQALTPNVVSFNNTNDSNSELIKSYQNYCKILNVFKINGNTNSNMNVNNNTKIVNNINNVNNMRNVKMCNPIINNATTHQDPTAISIGYSSGSGPSNSNGSYHSDSSTTPSPRNSPPNVNSNRLSDEEQKAQTNARKPLYSAITATVPSAPPNTTSMISLSSARNTEPVKQPSKPKRRWRSNNHYRGNNGQYNQKHAMNGGWNEVVAPVPFSRCNNRANNNNNNEHRNGNGNGMYYYKESTKWRLKPNNGNNYRDYSQNPNKRRQNYSNTHHQRPSF
eukprot:133192_1